MNSCDTQNLFESDDFFSEHWKDMPEFLMNDNTSFRKIVVHFASEEDFMDFQEKISQKLGSKQPSCWYPKVDHRKTSHLRYIKQQ